MAMNGRRGYRSGLVDLRVGEISREIFVNEEIYAEEQERIFARAWLHVGHESPKPPMVTSRTSVRMVCSPVAMPKPNERVCVAARILCSSTSERGVGVARDHPLLVRRNYPRQYAGLVAADTAGTQLIAFLVHGKPQPAAASRNFCSCRSVIFTNAGRKDDAVEATQCSR